MYEEERRMRGQLYKTSLTTAAAATGNDEGDHCLERTAFICFEVLTDTAAIFAPLRGLVTGCLVTHYAPPLWRFVFQDLRLYRK